MSDTVVFFAPLPILTVTIEDRAGEPDIHVHAGGQGVWQSRMVSSLGVPVVLCAALGGETGDVLGHLLPADGIAVRTVRVSSRNGAYVHDRRDGEREEVADAAGSPLDRHERDSLYELTLTEGPPPGRVLLSGRRTTGCCPRTCTVAWPPTSARTAAGWPPTSPVTGSRPCWRATRT